MDRKILIVDDSNLTHDVYKVFFARYSGCSILSARNGREALDVMARENGVDLVLLDLDMPVMNGFEFLQNVRVKGRFRKIPVVVISWNEKEAEIERAISLGAREFIPKSETDALGACIRKYLLT